MSIKIVMAPLTGGKTDRPVLDAAYLLACSTKAHIHVVFLLRDPADVLASSAGIGMGGGMAVGILESISEAAIEQVENARKTAQAHYDSWRQETGVREASDPTGIDEVTAERSEVSGDPRRNLINMGRLVDVICIMNAGASIEYDSKVLMEAALMETSSAVLLAPSNIDTPPIKSVAIAWNNSLEATRAVMHAMPILTNAETVTVLAGIGNQVSLEDVDVFVASLRWHGVDAKSQVFTAEGVILSDRLQVEAQAAGAQLLVLGAYSHSRLREFVMGGVTDDIVQAARMPVLMVH